MPLLFILIGPKIGFSARRGDTLPRRSALSSQISNFGHTFAPQGSLVCTFLRNSPYCTRLYVAFTFLIWSLLGDKHQSYKHFPAMGAVSLKFSIAPSDETANRIKKSCEGAKMARTSSITKPSMVGIVGRAPAVDEKVRCFFLFCLFFVALWNDKVCDNGNTMKQGYSQNNYGVITYTRRFVVVQYAPMFNFFCGPPEFSRMDKFILKITIFAIFGTVSPHFKSHKIWHDGAYLGLPSLSHIR